MRLLLCGGGTEGHIAPSLALAEVMKQQGDSFLFVGRKHGEENKKILKYQYPYLPIDIKSYAAYSWYEKGKWIRNFSIALRESKSIIESYKPDAVFATGGYVSLPPILIAKNKKIPFFLHESNAICGRMTKAMMRHAETLFLGMPNSEQNFKNTKKFQFTGTPVRKSFFEKSKDEARRKLGIGNEFMIFSFGGSQGAERLNDVCLKLMLEYSLPEGISHVHITGRRYFDTNDKTHHFSSFSDSKCRAVSFVDNIEDYMIAADVVICRSGASTISEVLASGAYPIFIPSPNVINNHQFYNAKAISDLTKTPLLAEDGSLYDELKATVIYARNNPLERKQKSVILKGMSTPECAEGILKQIKTTIQNM